MSTIANIIKLNPLDDVAIATLALPAGSLLEGTDGVRTATEIPGGHKVALRTIQRGDPVHKYGQIIGFATQDIAPGQHVHIQTCLWGMILRGIMRLAKG